MKKIRTGLVTLLALSLFLSPIFLIGGSSSNALNSDKSGSAVNAEDIYGQSRKNDPVSILVYTQFADLSAAGEFAHTMQSIDAEYGTSYQYENLTDYHGLASVINEYDILLIPEQENAYFSNMTAVGLAWASTLSTFINNGGIVILMDYWGFLNIPSERLGITSHIYNSSGLMTITGFHDESYTSMTISDSNDALSLGVTTPFSTTDGAVTYDTTDGVKVAGSASGALAVHKIIGKGHLILLGFDFYLVEPNCIKMLANSIRLHHHVVFDASHNPDMHLQVEFYQFALNLAEEGFASSAMTTFNPAVLAACDVLVLSYCSIAYNSTEVNQIENFVNNGGGLFVAQEWGTFGNSIDPVSERFGYIRNATNPLHDSDDYEAANTAWVVFDIDNTRNHSATLDTTSLEMYGGTVLEQIPVNAYTLIVTDSDDTVTISSEIKNGYTFAAASTHVNGRVIVIGDGNMLNGVSDTDGDATTNFDERNNGYFAVSCIRWLLGAGIEEKIVLFDESHNPTYTLGSKYIEFAYFLTLNGYTLHWMESFYQTLIELADVLVIVDGSTDYTGPQINFIVNYVVNGGSLYLLGDWGIYGQQVGAIGAEFGLIRNGTGWIEDSDDFNTYSSVIAYNTSNFAVHPIMQGVNHIELDRSCGFSSVGVGVALVRTDGDGTSYWSDGGYANNVAVIAATTYNMGRVLFVPDLELFSTDDPDGDGVVDMYESDNDIFSINAFAWLVANRAPTVHITFPNGGEILNGTQFITWTSIDFDNDPMTYDLYLSDNNGSDWVILANDLVLQEFEWNTTLHDDGTGYMIRVVVSDGSATNNDESDTPFELDNFADGGGGTPLDPTLLIIVAAAGVVIVIIILIFLKKKK